MTRPAPPLLLALLALAGCAASVGSPRDPTGTVHERYAETWQDGKMTGCQMSRDAGVEFQGAAAQWRPCGRQFDTNVAAEQAFRGQEIGAALQAQAYTAWSQGFNAGLQTITPLACTAAAIAAAPPLAAICGIVKPPTKPTPPVVAVPPPPPAPPAFRPSLLMLESPEP